VVFERWASLQLSFVLESMGLEAEVDGIVDEERALFNERCAYQATGRGCDV
jgi:hypothetical protein